MIELAHRSGEIESIEAHVVYENDEFHFEYGKHPDIVHKPTLTNKGEPIAYYATYHTKNGGFGFEVMSIEDVKEFANKYSQAYKNGRNSPWATDFNAMSLKTVLKQVLKYAPLKTEFAREVATDSTIKSYPIEKIEDDEDVNIIDLPSEDYNVELAIDPDTGEVGLPLEDNGKSN